MAPTATLEAPPAAGDASAQVSESSDKAVEIAQAEPAAPNTAPQRQRSLFEMITGVSPAALAGVDETVVAEAVAAGAAVPATASAAVPLPQLPDNVHVVGPADAAWVPDASALECTACSKPFHFIVRRRHHCRLCGSLFCNDCASNYLPAPQAGDGTSAAGAGAASGIGPGTGGSPASGISEHASTGWLRACNECAASVREGIAMAGGGGGGAPGEHDEAPASKAEADVAKADATMALAAEVAAAAKAAAAAAAAAAEADAARPPPALTLPNDATALSGLSTMTPTPATDESALSALSASMSASASLAAFAPRVTGVWLLDKAASDPMAPLLKEMGVPWLMHKVIDAMRPSTELRLSGRVFSVTMTQGVKITNQLEIGVPGTYKGGDGVGHPASLMWDGHALTIDTTRSSHTSTRSRYAIDGHGRLILTVSRARSRAASSRCRSRLRRCLCCPFSSPQPPLAQITFIRNGKETVHVKRISHRVE